MTSSGPEDRSGVVVGRYVDGEMDVRERASFEAQIADDVALRDAVDSVRRVRALIALDRPVDVPQPSDGFRQRVLAAASVAPAAAATSGRGPGGTLEAWCRRVVWAAAAVLAFAVLVVSGVLRMPDSGRLEASSAEIERAMDQLDQKILRETGEAGARGR